jgi:maltose O-acetyltransferase
MYEMAVALPHAPRQYLQSPAQTLRKISEWLSARLWLRACNEVGAWTRVTGKVFVQNRGRIVLGERVQIQSHFAHTVLATFPGGLLEVGDRTFINYGVDIAATKLVHIGSDCLIGTHVIILDNDFHGITDRERVPEARPVFIGDRAWIGNRATILPGVTIGEDAVVGAGSVVTSDVPPRSVAVGNPARVIKTF